MSSQLDPRLKTAIFAVATFGAMFSAVGGTFFGLRAGASIAVGATIGASNLYALARVVRALATPGASRSVASWTFALLLKMILLFGGIWLLLAWHSVTVIPLVVGYMTVPIGVALGSLVSDRTEPPQAAP
jgi:hypothetical protein